MTLRSEICSLIVKYATDVAKEDTRIVQLTVQNRIECDAAMSNQTSNSQSHADIAELPPSTSASTSSTSRPRPAKLPRLIANYTINQANKVDMQMLLPISNRVSDELNKYLQLPYNQTMDKCLSFWHLQRYTLPLLYMTVLNVLSIPATSAPVERICSTGRIILRPNRSRIKDILFSDLMFAKYYQL